MMIHLVFKYGSIVTEQTLSRYADYRIGGKNRYGQGNYNNGKNNKYQGKKAVRSNSPKKDRYEE